MLRKFRSAIPSFVSAVEGRAAPNPRAAFILAPPRSGTTLLRVMLAGHPELFAASELQLLGFNSLGERRRALGGRFSAWLEGLIRVVMELRRCDVERAKGIVADWEREDHSSKDVFARIQGWSGTRLLVDKSPSYSLDPGALAKAESDFAEPVYIHLVRRPEAMIRSFEQIHIDQVLFLKDHDFSSRELGELVWTESQRTVLTFLERIPPSRWIRIRFEDLVGNPTEAMERVAETLGVPFHPMLVRPYDGIERKMTDGLYEASNPMGDVKFRDYGRIDSSAAERWSVDESRIALGNVTKEVAERLGYETRPDRDQTRRGDPGTRMAAARARRDQRVRVRRSGRNDGAVE
jgi:hypothetical protein